MEARLLTRGVLGAMLLAVTATGAPRGLGAQDAQSGLALLYLPESLS